MGRRPTWLCLMVPQMVSQGTVPSSSALQTEPWDSDVAPRFVFLARFGVGVLWDCQTSAAPGPNVSTLWWIEGMTEIVPIDVQ